MQQEVQGKKIWQFKSLDGSQADLGEVLLDPLDRQLAT
jgi:hypothetical protein